MGGSVGEREGVGVVREMRRGGMVSGRPRGTDGKRRVIVVVEDGDEGHAVCVWLSGSDGGKGSGCMV